MKIIWNTHTHTVVMSAYCCKKKVIENLSTYIGASKSKYHLHAHLCNNTRGQILGNNYESLHTNIISF